MDGSRGAAVEGDLEATEKLIMRWDSSASSAMDERMLFDGGDHSREVSSFRRRALTLHQGPGHRQKPPEIVLLLRERDPDRHGAVGGRVPQPAADPGQRGRGRCSRRSKLDLVE
ncbi:hypothetical protein OPV22_026590 [Ensete ventricosum]|uniref:Uncharacterized protein n=1 Tax=Ensete ventricosum TaxID=4639 RepID=A0AAV8QKD5_ENSVE|nr:hypothetical protein OPV22_026590 [Ensete ventricosum]